jgi:hypothetical protein
MSVEGDLDRVAQAVADNESVGMGDADGSQWASTVAIQGALRWQAAVVDTARAQLHRAGRVERHPTGADYWRTTRRGGGGPS